jgi:hypothetical protein
MAVDMERVTDVLKEALLRNLGDEVDVIFRYGSLLKGAAHRYSDMDISYVPVHEETWHSITVMVGDVLCDLYPIHWSALEHMADFSNVSSSVLLKYQIVYARTDEARARFEALPVRLQACQQPKAHLEMLRRAQELFQSTGYPYYLLHQAAAQGHVLACMQQAQAIFRTVLHCLMVCNQMPIDTRKLPQVLALPRLPHDFPDTVERMIQAHTPGEMLDACETLLSTTRALLLDEQRQIQRPATFPDVFRAAYPELKADLQHILLACEQRDLSKLSIVSFYHELMIHIAWAISGVPYSGFNSIAEYEQDLAVLGFPDLLPYVLARDFDSLHRQCLAFDQRLREFLTERGVVLNTFDDVEALQQHLASKG